MAGGISLSFVNRRIFDSRVKTDKVGAKEKIFGYLIGPIGPALVNAVLASYLNVYYTDALGLTLVWRGLFLLIFPIVSKIANAAVNLWVGKLIERTHTRQGKARPYLLISAPIFFTTSALCFTVPSFGIAAEVIWVTITYNLFYLCANSFYTMAHNLMVPLSTRDSDARGSLSVMNNIAMTMATGIIIAMLFPMFVLPILGASREAWATMGWILGAIALPMILMEYYYTRERVTEEQGESEETEPLPFREQIKTVIHDRYWFVLMLYLFIYTLSMNFKNLSLLYYCNYVLGSYNDGITMTLVNVIGGIPMGLGIFAVWPIAKRAGLRNTTLVGFVIVAVGSAICAIVPTSMPIVLVGQFIKNIGCLPASYVFMALFADVLDHCEWRFGFRCDGLSSAIYSITQTVCGGIANGVFNLMLSVTGYIPPSVVDGVTVAAQQSDATKAVFVFFFLILDIITSIVIVFLLSKLDVEKTIGQEQAEIKSRHEAAATELRE
jgi:GPH family glycoside/pentoside/hexuronide:cation symporter